MTVVLSSCIAGCTADEPDMMLTVRDPAAAEARAEGLAALASIRRDARATTASRCDDAPPLPCDGPFTGSACDLPCTSDDAEPWVVLLPMFLLGAGRRRRAP